MTTARLTIAVQKNGRLTEDTFTLLEKCGIDVPDLEDKRLRYSATKFPIDIIRVRDDDIPTLVTGNRVTFGIVGSNVFEEFRLARAEILLDKRRLMERDDLQLNEAVALGGLGFAKCALSLAVMEDSPIQQVNDFRKRFAGDSGQASARRAGWADIVTSYPRITEKFRRENKLPLNICAMSGALEIMPSLGAAEGICDLVVTGKTLQENGLRKLPDGLVFQSEALLLCSPDAARENWRGAWRAPAYVDWQGAPIEDNRNAFLDAIERKVPYFLSNGPLRPFESVWDKLRAMQTEKLAA